MKSLWLSFVLILGPFVTPAAAGDGTEPCVNRSVEIEMEKKHVEELKNIFFVQSHRPYTATVTNKGKTLSRVVISYRRKSSKDDYSEPTNPGFFKEVADPLMDRYESLGIKKISAQIIPGSCL